MLRTDSRSEAASTADAAAAFRDGDEPAFTALVEPYRRQLHVHCYRMMGSYDDADDMLQETLLRAWTRRAGFEGRSALRTWLYRIATNVCLDALDRRRRRVIPPDVAPARADLPSRIDVDNEIPWLQPYPDHFLEPVAPAGDQPEEVAVRRETIEIAYLAAIQHLPPRQRAVVILRDSLGWSAHEAAALLETTTAAVNSAHQRARATLRERLPDRHAEWAPASVTDEERVILARYMAAMERADVAALAALLAEEVRVTMPPALYWVEGRDAVVALAQWCLEQMRPSDWRTIAVGANRQAGAAFYLRAPGEEDHRLQVLGLLTIRDGRIVRIDAFGCDLIRGFGLPPVLDA